MIHKVIHKSSTGWEPRKVILGAPILAILLLTAGCRGSNTIDRGVVEKAIRANAIDVSPAVDPESISVECPDNIKVEPGRTFKCIVNVDGVAAEMIEVEIQNDEGDIIWASA